MQHYHLHDSAQGGYLPDSSDTYTEYHEARQALIDRARQIVDDELAAGHDSTLCFISPDAFVYGDNILGETTRYVTLESCTEDLCGEIDDSRALTDGLKLLQERNGEID